MMASMCNLWGTHQTKLMAKLFESHTSTSFRFIFPQTKTVFVRVLDSTNLLLEALTASYRQFHGVGCTHWNLGHLPATPWSSTVCTSQEAGPQKEKEKVFQSSIFQVLLLLVAGRVNVFGDNYRYHFGLKSLYGGPNFFEWSWTQRFAFLENNSKHLSFYASTCHVFTKTHHVNMILQCAAPARSQKTAAV